MTRSGLIAEWAAAEAGDRPVPPLEATGLATTTAAVPDPGSTADPVHARRLFAPVASVVAFIALNLHQLAPDTTSDSLYPLSLARDVVTHRLRLRGWALPPALYLFPDVVVTTLLYAPGHNSRVAYFGHGVVFGVWFAVLGWLLVRRIGARLSPAVRSWVWAGGMGLLCSASLVNRGLFLLAQMFFSGAFHDGAFLVSLTVVLLVSSQAESRTRRRTALVVAGLLLSLGTFSDPLVLAQGVVPALVVWWMRRRGQHRGAGVAWPVVLIASPVAGLLGTRLLLSTGFVQNTAGSPHPSVAGLGRFARDVPTLFAGYPVWAGCSFVSVVAIAQLLRARVGSTSPPTAPDAVRPLCWGLVSMVGVGSVVTAATGYSNIDHVRRDLPLLVFPLLLGPLVVALALARTRHNRPRHTHRHPSTTWMALCAVCAVASVTGSLSAAKKAGTAWLAPDLPYYAHQRCLDDLHRSGRAGSGLGDYWAARLFTETSRSHLVVAPIDMDGTYLAAIANPDVVLAPASNRSGVAAGPLNFIIPNRLPDAVLERTFGTPTVRLRCAGMPVWLYPPGALAGSLARLQQQAERLPGARTP